MTAAPSYRSHSPSSGDLEFGDGTRTLSVVIPAFNEGATIDEVLRCVLESRFTGEVIVVDDGSSDDTYERARSCDDPRVRVIRQPRNQGKGAALRAGFAATTQPYVIVQDADLEYSPDDYEQMMHPLLEGRADVVIGSRFLTDRPRRVLYFWHSAANRMLTLVSNIFTDLNLTDMETCYKAFRREVLASFVIEEDRFGVEPEIVAKVAAGRWRIYEVGISYWGRTYDEGKKIGWRDGIRAFACTWAYSELGRRLGGRTVLRALKIAMRGRA
jgi:glycosyltransferase involved in cell wall biosynthesis